jgi:hypothetical protein
MYIGQVVFAKNVGDSNTKQKWSYLCHRSVLHQLSYLCVTLPKVGKTSTLIRNTLVSIATVTHVLNKKNFANVITASESPLAVPTCVGEIQPR